MACCILLSCSKGGNAGGGSSPAPAPTKKAATLPEVINLTTDLKAQTTAPYVASHDSIVSGGEVWSDGGSPVTAYGVCWSTAQNPTIADNKTLDGSGKGYFTSNIGGLQVATTYYLRAYATNAVGTDYSQQYSLTTKYIIGEKFGGGILVYVDDTKLNGYIATTYAFTETAWGTGVAGAYSAYDGVGNTEKIVQAFGANANNAATLCRACRDGGYSDWFLPAINQLTLLGTPSNGDTYWSSTETTNNTDWAYATGSPYGNPFAEIKSIKHEVRPIRAF